MIVYEFDGIESGDHEAFCWDVDAATYQRLAGRAPDEHDESAFNAGLYRLYPGFWGTYAEDSPPPKRRYRIEVTEVET